MGWAPEGGLLWEDPTWTKPNYKLNMGEDWIIIGHTPNGKPITIRKSEYEESIVNPDKLKEVTKMLEWELEAERNKLDITAHIERGKLQVSVMQKAHEALYPTEWEKFMALKREENLALEREKYLANLKRLRAENEARKTMSEGYINLKTGETAKTTKPISRYKQLMKEPDYNFTARDILVNGTQVSNMKTGETAYLDSKGKFFRLAHYMTNADKANAVNALHREFGQEWLAKALFVLKSKQYPIKNWVVNDNFACTLFDDNTILIYKTPVPDPLPPEPEVLWNEEDIVQSQLNWK